MIVHQDNGGSATDERPAKHFASGNRHMVQCANVHELVSCNLVPGVKHQDGKAFLK